jgi:hypothetical protein
MRRARARTFVVAAKRLFERVCRPTERCAIDLRVDELERRDKPVLSLGVLRPWWA